MSPITPDLTNNIPDLLDLRASATADDAGAATTAPYGGDTAVVYVTAASYQVSSGDKGLRRTARRFGLTGLDTEATVRKAVEFVENGRFVSAVKTLEYAQAATTSPERREQIGGLIGYVTSLHTLSDKVFQLKMDDLRAGIRDEDISLWGRSSMMERHRVYEVEVIADATWLADKLHAERLTFRDWILEVMDSGPAADYLMLVTVAAELRKLEQGAVSVARRHLPGFEPECPANAGCEEHAG